MQQSFQVVILRGDPPEELTFSLQTPVPKYKDNPYSEPTALATGTQSGNISYLRVSLFPERSGSTSRMNSIRFSPGVSRMLIGSSLTCAEIRAEGSAVSL